MNEPNPPGIYDVFVSYHSGDAEWVTALVADLKSRRVTVWLDREQIRPGDLFISSLEEALTKVHSVVFVISPGSLRSKWVQEEFHRALTLANTKTDGRRLIPILIDNAEPPGFLANRSWVDFRDSAKRKSSLDELMFGITGHRANDAAAGTSTVFDVIRSDTTSAQLAGDVDEADLITRQIARVCDEVRRIQRTRWLALLPGLAIFGAFWAFSQDTTTFQLLGTFVSAPLFTELIAWGVTAAPLGSCKRKLEKFEMLRDGLEMCRQRTAPGCKALNEKFWEIVLHQSGDPAALS